MAEADQAQSLAERSETTESPSSLWRHLDFILLWGGQSVSELGSAITAFALPLVAVVDLHASAFQVGLLTAFSTLPCLMIALPAGVIVDRIAKRLLMLGCDVTRMLIIASIPLVATLGVLTMGQFYAVTLIIGACTVLFDIAYQSYLPVLVSRSQLVDGNGKLGATRSIAEFAGPAAGGLLVSLIGAAPTLTVDALSYAVSVVCLRLIRTPEPRATPGRVAEAPESIVFSAAKLRRDIGEGLKFVIGHSVLRKILACAAVSNLCTGMVDAIAIVFLVRVLHVKPTEIGALFAFSGLGSIAGAASSSLLTRRIGPARMIWFSVLVVSFPSLLIPIAEPGWRVTLFAAGWFAYGAFIVQYNIAQRSYRQTICPPELLGRMNATMRWIIWGTLPVGGLLGGALGSVIGVRPTLWIAVTGSWAAGFFVFFSPLRKMVT
jgi:MFS family permease